jgi:hypothetical protein
MNKTLLYCGILASLLYAAMNIFIPLQWPAYSSFSYTVSELSAVDAPTRSVWVVWASVYTLLMALFGWGVLRLAKGQQPLLWTGWLLLVYGIFGLFWPPMHQRYVLAAGGHFLTDTMHLVFAGVTVLLMIGIILCGMYSFRLKWFRFYSVSTLVLLSVFGLLTSLGAPKVQANLPTPWLGVWERINIGVYLVWVIVLALLMMKRNKQPL